jgi:hypothetical protein
MSERLRISRRDFLNGIALGVAAGSALSPLEAMARSLTNGTPPVGDGLYPPALTGMRGNHPGSFEVSHALSWAGAKWPRPERQTDRTYDLVVVGAGISGLSAAYFYRQHVGRDARILVIDNHDDFGGHAKRNEFDVNRRKLICYGGSQSIDAPGNYSAQAKKLLEDIAVHTERFYDYFDQDFFSRRGLGRGIWFSREAYGEDRLLPNVMRVRQLIPEAVPGRSMEDLVTARVDYASLDCSSARVRIRLDSTAVDVRHAEGGKTVDVSYVRKGEAYRVRAKHAVLACYNNMVPHICSDYSDPPHWGREEGPHVQGRAQIGRISIANSDAAAYAYVDGAIDAAHRAVSEQLATASFT